MRIGRSASQDDQAEARKIMDQVDLILRQEVLAGRLPREEAWRIGTAVQRVVLGEQEKLVADPDASCKCKCSGSAEVPDEPQVPEV